MKTVTVYVHRDFIRFVNVIEVSYSDGMCHITWLANDGSVEPRKVVTSFSVYNITRVDIVE